MAGEKHNLVKLGWMWFDDDPRTSLADKIRRASGRYQQKFGHWPRVCYVNQQLLPSDQTTIQRVRLRPAANVLPGHFLFVVEEGAST